MVRKNRDLIEDLGFELLPRRGKGSHRQWRHPKTGVTIRIAGKNGDDVHHYNEAQLEEAKKTLEELGA